MSSAALVTDFAIVLSQSCNAENLQKPPLDFVAVGAVRSLIEMPAGNHENCRHNKLLRYHHLPADVNAGSPESYVHFALLPLVPQPSLPPSKHARLLPWELPHPPNPPHTL